MESVFDIEAIYKIIHFLGIVVGMGGALASDAIFFSSIRDEKISHTEMRFLRLGGRMVSVGVGVILLSGILLFSLRPEEYLTSAKFLAKMTVVLVILVNGVIFHVIHIPRLHRHAGEHFPSSDEFVRRAPLLIASGAISIISWLSALILGALHSLPYSYLTIIGIYALAVIVSATIVVSAKRLLIPHLYQKNLRRVK